MVEKFKDADYSWVRREGQAVEASQEQLLIQRSQITMLTANSSTRLLAFKDQMAPYRGTWVLYSSKPDRRFIACHEIEDESKNSRLPEQSTLNTMEEVRQFSAHLNRMDGRQVTR